MIFKDNVHIFYNTNMSADELSIGDNILDLKSLNGGGLITNHFRLDSIDHGKLYNFSIRENEIEYLEEAYSEVRHYERKEFVMLNHDGKLIYLFDKTKTRGVYEKLLTHIYDNYYLKNNGKNIFNKFQGSGDYGEIQKYFYYTIPLDEHNAIILTLSVAVKDNKAYSKEEKILKLQFHDYGKEEYDSLKNINFLFYRCRNIGYDGKLKPIVDSISNLECSRALKTFKELVFSVNYDIEEYLKDDNREYNLNKANQYFNKYITKIDLKQEYSPVFVDNETNIKSYLKQGYPLVTLNDSIVNVGEGYFVNRAIDNGKVRYEFTCPKEFMDNDKLQSIYKAAYQYARFIDSGYGVNTITGDYYRDGKIDNSSIIYKDDMGIVIGKYDCYIKKYGYYIDYKSYYCDDEDANLVKELMSRYELVKTLSQKAPL